MNLAKLIVIAFLLISIISYISIQIFIISDAYFSNEVEKERAYRRQMKKINLQIDSLFKEIAQRDSFLHSIKQAITGEGEIEKAKLLQQKPIKSPEDKQKIIDKLSDAEIMLRKQYEYQKQTQLAGFGFPKTSSKENLFFVPANGYISRKYNVKENHLGIDIVSVDKEPIKGVADGTVVYAGWGYETGYMLVIQHQENLISVYKHNAELFKKVGDSVKKGEVIALMGNSGEKTTGTHLHFEIWLNGKPVDPAQYIIFDK
jgi:murein DD-endopeptidase MepM/ murein hydrolase activator NlpD